MVGQIVWDSASVEDRGLCGGPASFSFRVVLAVRVVEGVGIAHVALLVPGWIFYVSCGFQLLPPAWMLAACLLLGCYVSSSIYRRQDEHSFQAPVFALAILAATTPDEVVVRGEENAL